MKRFVLNIVCIVVCVTILHVLLFYLLKQPGIPPMMGAIDRITEEGADIVYLGDSCVTDYAPEDTDKRNLPQILDEKLNTQNVVGAAHYAYHGELFHGICYTLSKGENLPDIVLIPINLRSFSPVWDKKPEYQFEKMKYLLSRPNSLARISLRPLSVFDYIDLIPITQQEFEAVPVLIEGKKIGTVADFEGPMREGDDVNEYFRRQFLYTYGYTLEPGHRKLQGIVQAIRILQENDIIPIIYITPFDYQSALAYTDITLLNRINSNIELIQKTLEAEGVHAIDLSQTLGPDAFCYDTPIHEHLDQAGREFVSDRLVEVIEATFNP